MPVSLGPLSAVISGKKKTHKHKLFWSGWSWDDPRNVPGKNRAHFVPGANPGFLLILRSGSPVCPRDKPSLSLGQSRGRRVAKTIYVLKIYVPFSLAIIGGGKKPSRPPKPSNTPPPQWYTPPLQHSANGSENPKKRSRLPGSSEQAMVFKVGKWGVYTGTLIFFSLFSSGNSLFFSCARKPLFLIIFPSFLGVLGVLPAFLVFFVALFQQKQGKEDQGKSVSKRVGEI